VRELGLDVLLPNRAEREAFMREHWAEDASLGESLRPRLGFGVPIGRVGPGLLAETVLLVPLHANAGWR